MFEYYNQGDKKWLLSKLNQEKVWSNILGYSLEINKWILNPLRTDKHIGSCKIIWSNKSENLVLMDFADTKTTGFDCVSAYQYLYPLKSWREVCGDLLTLASINPTSSYTILPGLNKPNEEVLFEVFYKEWTEEDLDWWSLRNINLSQLNRDITLVKPAVGYIQTTGKKKSEIHFNEQCYCYHHSDKIKLYFPNRKSWRFLGNMNRDSLWKIPGNNNLIITKAHKDALVLENCVDFTITHLQSETSFPSSNFILDWEMYESIHILLDNDKQGRESAEMLKQQFLYKEPKIIFTQDYKDIDEMMCAEGLKETTEYLNYLLYE